MFKDKEFFEDLRLMEEVSQAEEMWERENFNKEKKRKDKILRY